MKNLTYLGLLSVPFCLGQHVSAQTAEQAKSASQQKPNIIFILADDMGYGDVSAYNKDSHIQTRHIDQMAANGVMFTDAHSCSAVSTPTRYGILTGRYNWRSSLKSGVLYGYSRPIIPTTRSTMASMLKANGFASVSVPDSTDRTAPIPSFRHCTSLSVYMPPFIHSPFRQAEENLPSHHCGAPPISNTWQVPYCPYTAP